MESRYCATIYRTDLNLAITLDFEKLPSERNITVWLGPENSFADFSAPTAAEINAMQNVSHALSWQDWDFGIQASETVNEPSFADSASYTDFGAAAYGGGASFYYPKNYDDPSNDLSLAYDLTDKPHTMVAIAIRVDGDKKNSTPAQDGDYIHTFLTMTDSEVNNIQGAEALRRTVGFLQQSVFSVYTVVGMGSTPPTVDPALALAEGEAERLSVKVVGREFTNACDFRVDDPDVARVSGAGVVRAIGAGTAEITVTNPYNKTSSTVTVTVS